MKTNEIKNILRLVKEDKIDISQAEHLLNYVFKGSKNMSVDRSESKNNYYDLFL